LPDDAARRSPGRPSPSAPGGNLPSNSDALHSPLLPSLFSSLSLSPFSLLFPLFFQWRSQKRVFGPCFFSLFLFPCFFLVLFYIPLFSSFPLLFLRSKTPEMQLGDLGERCELFQRDLGRSPSRNRIWCILTSKDETWWQ